MYSKQNLRTQMVIITKFNYLIFYLWVKLNRFYRINVVDISVCPKYNKFVRNKINSIGNDNTKFELDRINFHWILCLIKLLR